MGILSQAFLLSILSIHMMVHADGVPAESRQNQARSVLIEKLNQIYLNLSADDPSKSGLNLRLADLLAERARVDSMVELNSGCIQCTAGQADRLRAIELYKEAIPKLPTESVGKVMAQLGQLSLLMGNEAEAISTFQKIIIAPVEEAVKSEAILSLADISFKRRDFLSAQGYYEKILSNPMSSGKGLANYKLAWCKFNQGFVKEAVAQLKSQLLNKDLLSRFAQAGVDPQFHAEVARDYVIFMAREKSLEGTNITVSAQSVGVEDVLLLSPSALALENLELYANELERLGKATESIEAWKVLLQKQKSSIERLETEFHLAVTFSTAGKKPDSAEHFSAAISLMRNGACQGVDCSEIKTRLRNFLIDWTNAEKKNPSVELLGSYEKYLSVNTSDAEAFIWASELFKTQKNYSKAAESLVKASKLPGSHQETSLLAIVEVAELSKDSQLMAFSYDNYLNLSKDKKREFEVSYQKAHYLYEKGQYLDAANEFRKIVLAKTNSNTTLKLQAAELALDSLVLLKNDSLIEIWSNEFASMFPEKAKEFDGISLKAILSQVAANQADSLKSWSILEHFQVSKADPELKKSYYKNRIILAEKLKKLSEARNSVEGLLSVSAVGSEDYQFALTRKIWLSELALDFDGALKATEMLPGKALDLETKNLKLAMYSEFSAKDPLPYYKEFLRSSKDNAKKAQVAALILKTSNNLETDLDKYSQYLVSDSELLGGLYLEAFAKTKNLNFLKKALARKDIAKTKSGKILARFQLLEKNDQLVKAYNDFKVDGSSQSQLAKGLKKRVDQIKATEAMASEAQGSEDWTSQVVALSTLANQSERFYQEIISLPVPNGLNADQESEYLQLLSSQASPYLIKSQDINKKIEEFWSQENILVELKEAAAKVTPELYSLELRELNSLSQSSSGKNKDSIEGILSTMTAPIESTAKLDVEKLEAARQGVRENPYSIEKLNALINVEKVTGKFQFVEYLEGRMKTLQEVQ